MSEFEIRSAAEANQRLSCLRQSAHEAVQWIVQQELEPLEIFRQLKFDQVGRHPIEDRPLNFIEQLNQTWTYAVAIIAAKQLLLMHPDAGGFYLAPGAHAARELDIMSITPGLVGAETFAAVAPRNNRKLAGDLAKLASRAETYRYVFFASPQFPGNRRVHSLEQHDVQVWSIDLAF